jgi:aminoglycoside/choline kinase family phosphotransferase
VARRKAQGGTFIGASFTLSNSVATGNSRPLLQPGALLREWHVRHPHQVAVAVNAIERGGSGRKFWRMHVGGLSLIFVRYGEDRPENRHYVDIARFLAGVGVRVPVIHFHDEKEGLIVMEDAGDADLWSYRHAPWPQRRALYQRTLDQALVLHTMAHSAPAAESLKFLQPVFDAVLYRWEQDYFFEHCLGRHFKLSKLPGPDTAAGDCRRTFRRAALSGAPRFSKSEHHRARRRGLLIDFQGLRPGLAPYDLASLLLDPYVDLTDAEARGVARALSQRPARSRTPGQSALPCALRSLRMQRLMQALVRMANSATSMASRIFSSTFPSLSRACAKFSRASRGPANCARCSRNCERG